MSVLGQHLTAQARAAIGLNVRDASGNKLCATHPQADLVASVASNHMRHDGRSYGNSQFGGARLSRTVAPSRARSQSHLTAMHLFTIGYEGATQPELVAALQAAGVGLLADIRALPLSRRPGFSKNILAAGLREGGIDYVGLKALGTPPEGREAARRGDHATLARVYAGQLELPEAMLEGAQLRGLAEERPTALLCFERDPHGCHRSLLIEAIMPDATVTHLFA